jgi:hypothetical protein
MDRDRRWCLLLGALFASACLDDPELSSEESEIYTYTTLPSNLRVAVILYDFENSNTWPSSTETTYLPHADVVDLMFEGTGHDGATGSVNNYFYEVTDDYMRVSGTVYNWLTLPRKDHVWRHSSSCMNGLPPQSLAGSYFCNDPIQPLPAGTNTWLVGPMESWASCPAGSSSVRPFIPAGNDWCYDPVYLDANLIPTIKATAAAACGTTDTGTTRCGFNEADYDAVIYASPYSIQGTYPGGKSMFGEARERPYTMHVFAHELGHFLGLNHAKTFACTNNDPSTCTTASEYGDGTSLMASNWKQLNGYEKLGMGAISSSHMRAVTASGQYTIKAHETPWLTSRVLRVATGQSYPGSVAPSYFYLESRKRLRYDAQFPVGSPFVNGVTLHLATDHTQRYLYGGSPSSACGASCADWWGVASSGLLDGTPWTATHDDAALVSGASFTEPKQGITMQVARNDASTSTVDITFRPANAKLFFYHAAGGRLLDYWQYAAGGIQFVSEIFGAATTWTHVVGANNGGLLWYNRSTGAAYSAYVDDTNVYRSKGALALAADYSHVVAAGRGNLLFYNDVTGAFMTATIDPDGTFTQKQTGTFNTGWTSIAGTLAGGVVFYKSSNGQLTAGKLDGNGNFSNWQNPAAIATGYTSIATVREQGLVFYNRTFGSARTAVLDDGNRLTFKSNVAWPTGFTQLVGHSNGTLFLYRTSDGFSRTTSINANFVPAALQLLNGISPGQILGSAGGV